MFIVENHVITNIRSVDLSEITDIVFYFPSLVFDNDDIFVLNANGVENKLYGYSKNGYLKFVAVDYGKLFNGENHVSIEILRNGENICSEMLTVKAEINEGGSGGGGTVSAEFPLTTEKIQLFTKKVNGKYYFDPKTSNSTSITFQDDYFLEVGQTATHEFLYENIDIKYQISPVDDLQVIFSLWYGAKYIDVIAELYVDDVLIRRGENRRTFGEGFFGSAYYRTINLAENFCKDVISAENKTLKLILKVVNRSTNKFTYRLRGGNWGVQPTDNKGSESGNISLIKNFHIVGFDNIYNMCGYTNSTRNNVIENARSHFAPISNVEYYNSQYYYLSIYGNESNNNELILPETYLNNGVTVPKLRELTVYIDYLFCSQYADCSHTIIFHTDDSFTFNFQVYSAQDDDLVTYLESNVAKDWLINKPFNFQPNKAYMLHIYQNYIWWCEMTNAF